MITCKNNVHLLNRGLLKWNFPFNNIQYFCIQVYLCGKGVKVGKNYSMISVMKVAIKANYKECL